MNPSILISPQAPATAAPPAGTRCRIAPLLAACALAAIVSAPETPAAPTAVGPDVAVMQIQVGRNRKDVRQVVIGLYDDAAPVTVANFKELAARRFYRGIRFHRVFPNTLVQTGDPITRLHLFAARRPLRAGTGGPGYTLPAEIRAKHTRGAVAMASIPNTTNPAKASNGSQFYICLEPSPELDGKFTVFGEVLEGLDLLDQISNMPADSNDFPLQNIFIRSIEIQPRFAVPAGR
jgi:peptidyl-prolyl cis-trans isomerase B (cyclophilin B)